VTRQPVPQPVGLAIGVRHRMCAALLHEGWRSRWVCFRHSAPKDLGIYHRVFGCRIEFDAEFNAIEEVNDTARIRAP